MRRGVTLVELLIVILIIVVLVAVLLPMVKYGIEQGRLREGARLIDGQFAAARARAMASGRQAGVWLELERIGDPAAAVGLYQCRTLFQADVQRPYTGDVSDARCRVAIGRLNTPADAPPWAIDFQGSAFMLPGLVGIGETFQIKLDGKGLWFNARRTAVQYEIIGPAGGNRPPRIPGPGLDGKPGVAGVDDNANGVIDHEDINGNGRLDPGEDLNGNRMLDDDTDEYLWPGSDDRNLLDYRYEVRLNPVRTGQPLELPQGIVIDPTYSGVGSRGNEFAAASVRLLVMFSPSGEVASVSYIDQATGNLVEDTGVGKLHLLVGRTEQVDYAWQNVPASNIADGGNLWLTINRRTGSVGTTDNSPNVSLPIGTPQERAAYLAAAREFATAGDVKGGQ